MNVLIDCPVNGCDSELNVEVNSGVEGDASIPYGTRTILDYDAPPCDNNHSYDTMTPAEQQLYAERVSIAYIEHETEGN